MYVQCPHISIMHSCQAATGCQKKQKKILKKNSKHAVDVDVLMPINIDANHWFLIEICMRDKCFKIYDSLYKVNEYFSENPGLGNFVLKHTIHKPGKWTTKRAPCPRQGNTWDCGVWVCINAFYAASGCARWPIADAHVPAARKLISHMILNWDRAILKFRSIFFIVVVCFLVFCFCIMYTTFLTTKIDLFA